jgi:hypothetical protein
LRGKLPAGLKSLIKQLLLGELQLQRLFPRIPQMQPIKQKDCLKNDN